MARILIVDDDPSTLSLERLLLTEAGHDVLLAHTAREGLNLLKLYQVDLIIVDIMMPDLNGFQFVNLLRNNSKLPQTAVAFLTSKSNKYDILRAGKVGADFFLVKPIVNEAFLKKVENFFAKNPPKEYARIKFQKPLSVDLKICDSAQITVISDMGIEILTDIPLEIDQVLSLSTFIFQEIPLKNPLMRVLSIQYDVKNLKRVRLMFMDQDSENVHLIQRWIHYNNLKQRHG